MKSKMAITKGCHFFYMIDEMKKVIIILISF